VGDACGLKPSDLGDITPEQMNGIFDHYKNRIG
jgi:hypothetical protein